MQCGQDVFAGEAGQRAVSQPQQLHSKDDMLLFAFHPISDRVEQRIRTAVADAGPPDTERTVLRALLVELLPLSEQAREEAPMWVAFLARALLRATPC